MCWGWDAASLFPLPASLVYYILLALNPSHSASGGPTPSEVRLARKEVQVSYVTDAFWPAARREGNEVPDVM